MPAPAISPTRPCADCASHSRALPLGGASSGSSARSPAARSSAICSPRHSRLFTATPVLQSPGATNQRLRDCGASAPARASRKTCPGEEPVKRPAEAAAISTTEAAGRSASPTQIGAGAPSTGSSAISAPPCPRRSTARAAIVDRRVRPADAPDDGAPRTLVRLGRRPGGEGREAAPRSDDLPRAIGVAALDRQRDFGRGSRLGKLQTSRLRRGKREHMRAGAGQRLRARRFEGAVVGLGRQGEAQLGLVPGVVVLAPRCCPRSNPPRRSARFAGWRRARRVPTYRRPPGGGATARRSSRRRRPVSCSKTTPPASLSTPSVSLSPKLVRSTTASRASEKCDFRRQIDKARDAGLQLPGL